MTSNHPPLPITRLHRPLSAVEHYHAAVGRSPRTLEVQREIFIVLQVESELSVQQWRLALDGAALANPGARLRLQGERRAACWISDGPLPRLRLIDDCQWDGQSSAGSEFLRATPIDLCVGPVVELIIASGPNAPSWVILRTPHAVMDGMGALHFLQEIFRVLREEPCIGTVVDYSDVDLMRRLGVHKSSSRHIRTHWLTGEPHGADQGDDWRRIPLGKPKKHQLARLAIAYAQFMHRSSDGPALIAIPVDLRRHAPGLVSTTNFSNMLLVPLSPGADIETFRATLNHMLEQRMDAYYPGILDAVRYLPLKWIDRLVSRTAANYQRRKPMETAVISNLGQIDTVLLSAPDCRTHRLFVVPLAGSVFSILTGSHGHVDLTLNLPRVLSCHGRFDALEAYLRASFAD